MKKKHIHFIIFLVLMAFSADLAFLLPSLAGTVGSAVYILMTGKIAGIMLAIIIGYLKLGCFKDE